METMDVQRILANTLSPDAEKRSLAEQALSEALQHQEICLCLLQLALAQNTDLSIRTTWHSASIILKKYVTEHWSPYFSTFIGNAPSVEVKQEVRQGVFQCLKDPDRKIRSLNAHTMSLIASCDWPDEFPDLLNSLIQLISTDSPDSVHGSVQVLAEFIKSDLTEDQILPVLRQLLPALRAIFYEERYTALTRARAVSVFRQCVMSLYMVKEQHAQAVKEATSTILPVWLDAFNQVLSIDPAEDMNQVNWDSFVVRTQIFKTLDVIYTSFPRAMTAYISSYLAGTLHHLKFIYPLYKGCYITGVQPTLRSSEDEAVELPYLICPMFDFLSNVIRGGKAKEWLKAQNLTDLVDLIFQYGQMTADDEDSLENTTNVYSFIALEEDDNQRYGVRVAGFDLLYTLLDRLQAQACAVFLAQLFHIITLSETARNGGEPSWWKSLEAALAAIGSHAEDILECIDHEVQSGYPKPLDIERLLVDVILPILVPSDRLSNLPFLQGRAFVFAGQFAKFLPLQLAGRYFDASMQVLASSDAGILVKLSAVKAIRDFCQGADDSAVAPFAAQIMQNLTPFLSTTTEDTLSLVLETLSVVLEIDKGSWLSSEFATSLASAVLAVWPENNKDPLFLSIFPDILRSLAASSAEGVYETVVQISLPIICSAIASAGLDRPWIAGSGIDLVSSLIQGAPGTGLGKGFFPFLAPSLFSCLDAAEDRDVLQSGVVCITSLIRKDCSQILSWVDSNSQSGLDHILKLIAKLLRNEDESGGLVIGDLIIHLFRRLGDQILPVLPDLLVAMAERMLTAKTATFLQSLVVPFAFLINNRADAVLLLLASNNVQGRSALDIVMQTLCENVETFQGFWHMRVSMLALCKLYLSPLPELQNLVVKGDIIVRPEIKNVIMTRSKTKTTPHEFTSVRFPVKVLKLLVHELRTSGESATIPTFEADSDDEDDEWTEEVRQDQGSKQDEFAFLSEMLGPRGADFDDDVIDESDDEDLRNDPVSQIDIKEYLVNFIRDCAKGDVNNFATKVDQLSAEEILVIRRVIEQQATT